MWDIIVVYAMDTINGCDEGLVVEFDFPKAPLPRQSVHLYHKVGLSTRPTVSHSLHGPLA